MQGNTTTTDSTEIAQASSLSAMISKAAAALASATTYAEVLDAVAHAIVAYDAAKIAARFARARQAHAEIIAACHKAQADALEIEAQAQCRLADEYDGAQQRGEMAKPGEYDRGNISNENISQKVTDIGLTSKIVHEARLVRDAERDNPGIVRKTLRERLNKGEAPTRADIKRATEPKPIIRTAPSTFAPMPPVRPEPTVTLQPLPRPLPQSYYDYGFDQDPVHLGENTFANYYADDSGIRIDQPDIRCTVYLHTDQLRVLVDWIENNDLLYEDDDDTTTTPEMVPDIESGRAISRERNADDDTIAAVASLSRLYFDNIEPLVARKDELTPMQRQQVAHLLWTAFERAKSLHDQFLTNSKPEGAQ